MPQMKVDDGKWWVSCDNGSSWIEVGEVAGQSNISVTQDADYVYITFNGETFVLPKAPVSPEDAMFVFNVNEVTSSSVNYDLAAADDNMLYILFCMEKELADQFATDEELYLDDMEYLSAYIEYGYTFEDLAYMGDIVGATTSDLSAETEYVLYVYGIDSDGTRLTDIYREYFTTLPKEAVEKIDVTFDIDAQVNGANIDVTVTPSDNEVLYYFDILSVAEAEEYYGGDYEAFMADLIAYYKAYGYTIDELIAGIASQGVDTYLFEGMDANTEYVIFAMALDEQGNVISDVATKNVTTENVAPSENVITLNVDAKTKTSVTVSTTTTNEDPYFLGIEPAFYFDGMTDEEIMETIIAEYGDYIEWSTEYGDVNALELIDLEPGTEYLLMAFGVQSGTATTGLVKQLVSTEAGTNPAECTFDIAIENVTETSAFITVTPSADDVRYVWDVADTGFSDEDIMAVYDAQIEEYVAAGYISGAREYWQMVAYTGVDYWEYEDAFAPGTEYDVFVAAVDMTAGELLTPFVRQSFTTLGAAPASAKSAQATVSLSREKKAPVRNIGLSSHRAVKKSLSAAKENTVVASMRKIDIQAGSQVKKLTRHSAILKK